MTDADDGPVTDTEEGEEGADHIYWVVVTF